MPKRSDAGYTDRWTCEVASDEPSAPEMQPYFRYVGAAMLEGDVASSLREIAELPLEKRYVWRVASALQWGFADFDDWSVAADRKTLNPEDGDKALAECIPVDACSDTRYSAI